MYSSATEHCLPLYRGAVRRCSDAFRSTAERPTLFGRLPLHCGAVRHCSDAFRSTAEPSDAVRTPSALLTAAGYTNGPPYFSPETKSKVRPKKKFARSGAPAKFHATGAPPLCALERARGPHAYIGASLPGALPASHALRH